MQALERKKEDVVKKSEKMNDFVKIDYFESCLKNRLDIDAMVYCSLELIRIYEKNSMFTYAIKHLNLLKNQTTSPNEKIKLEIKEVELLIKNSSYEVANSLFERILKSLPSIDRMRAEQRIIELYKAQANLLRNSHKSASEAKIYEGMLRFLNGDDKVTAKKRLLDLYKNLGKVKESLQLERELKSLPRF
jgi:hypothetical protein